MKPLVLILALLFSVSSFAVIETYRFDNDVQRQRYQNFIDELRCPKCQNQNLSGSDAAIAQDLRREIHRMIMAGKSDIEITQYMLQRYGDFVLYRPRMSAATSVLWLGPIALVLLGGLVWWRLSARRSGDVPVSGELSTAEQQRLSQLMDEGDDARGGSQRD
ncbi:uncharacterized protein involved in biosynthesis of c-type cytochromes [Spongiibacter sp. IMCC21906]|jgi:cytochrome c-type biogenesis protein CcmH|uniref:cytochrome c-type biogenesis protein n=1 Tax=Spongiibacter sp. IMCC21906 TaxID=1620392 RepID=UPI00062E0327|nr:cytochrome c-type biogenesis protein [Spongiibacter sp. IMCC21906]AKH69981.1 uncharacterized protein involved in biosynthesis of c-type cytochromes [Spongiibacter sp. IMCC21906]